MISIKDEHRNAKILEALRKQTQRYKANPDEARRFLMQLGCWNEDGTLKEEWGGNPLLGK